MCKNDLFNEIICIWFFGTIWVVCWVVFLLLQGYNLLFGEALAAIIVLETDKDQKVDIIFGLNVILFWWFNSRLKKCDSDSRSLSRWCLNCLSFRNHITFIKNVTIVLIIKLAKFGVAPRSSFFVWNSIPNFVRDEFFMNKIFLPNYRFC